MSGYNTNNQWKPRALSPHARTFGTLAALFVIGLSVNIVISIMTYLQFPPLLLVEEFDRRIYERLWQPTPVTVERIHPVIFIDVDNYSMRARARVADTRTPRALLAKIVHKVRDSGAAVVFLDIDFRATMNDDNLLDKELAQKGPPVLVPQFFTADATPACDSNLARAASHALSLIPNAIITSPNVIQVHALLEPGDFGMAEGVCLSYPTEAGGHSPPAAMWAAVQIANQTLGNDLQGVLTHPPVGKFVPIVWRLSASIRDFPAGPDKMAFHRIAAHWLEIPEVDLDVFKEAIVIVGSTHSGSGDLVRTPLGDISGALVHANVALTIQDPGASETYGWLEWLLHVLLLPIVIVLICWWPLYRRLQSHDNLTIGHRYSRLVQEFLVTIGLWPFVTGTFILVLFLFGRHPGSIPFGVMGFLVRSGLVLGIEAISTLSEEAERQTSNWIQRRIDKGKVARSAAISGVEASDPDAAQAGSDPGPS